MSSVDLRNLSIYLYTRRLSHLRIVAYSGSGVGYGHQLLWGRTTRAVVAGSNSKADTRSAGCAEVGTGGENVWGRP